MRTQLRFRRQRDELSVRWETADHLRTVLTEAEAGSARARPARRWRILPLRERVRAAETEIEQVIERLVSPELVDPYGVAMVRRLLTDGTGPLYWTGADTSLAAELERCLRRLERAPRPAPGVTK